MKTDARILVAGVVSCLLSGCGGDGGGDGGASLINEGVFLDSAVEGIRFETVNLIGFTDADGTFRYVTGEDVRFYIGDILLGSARGAPVLTPVDFVSGANSVSNDHVTNIIRFIQTLDEDYDSGNGIRITDPVHDVLIGQSIAFDRFFMAFETDPEVGFLVLEATSANGQPRLLIPAITAQAHMRATLEAQSSPDAPPLNDVGSLVITGDTNDIGTSFSPAAGLSFSSGLFAFSTLEWNEPRPLGGSGLDTAVRLEIRLSGNNPVEIALTWESQSAPTRNYGVSCSDDFISAFPSGSCAQVSVNAEARIVDISFLALTFRDDHSITIGLSGELAYP
jgi:hypothetical protein